MSIHDAPEPERTPKKARASSSAPARDTSSPTAAAALRLQRTAGNHAVAGLVSAAPTRHRALQRISGMQAFALGSNDGADTQWYNTICVPALTSIATRAGSDFNQYVGTLNKREFMAKVKELKSEVKAEGFWSSVGISDLIKSEAYPGKSRVRGTNLFIDDLELTHGLTAEHRSFIADYKGGRLRWFRGLTVSHFAWQALSAFGTLASEGTSDDPTFTMGNANPSRWLPGVHVADGCEAPAGRLDNSEAGLRDVVDRVEVPIGAIVEYVIAPGTPLAYLNDGEQVVRGPVSGVTVERVVLLGPGGFRRAGAGLPATALPPPAPYAAAVGDPALVNWEATATAWALAHP